jgi:hypothetical protein
VIAFGGAEAAIFGNLHTQTRRVAAGALRPAATAVAGAMARREAGSLRGAN